MTEVVMKEEDSDTSGIKELDVVLPRYQPVNGYKSPLDFILPPYQEYPRSWNYAGVFDYSVYDQFSPILDVTYSPPSPGGHLFLPYENLTDALYAEPLLCAKVGIHCYNLENGTNFERLYWPEVAEHNGVLTIDACDPARACSCKFEIKVWYPSENKDCFHVISSRCRALPPPTPEEEEKEESGFDIHSVDELFKGHMPDWLPGDNKLQYYEMKESEVKQAKGWLELYAELAWYAKKQTDPYMFEYGKPFELLKIVVQTKDVVHSMENLKLDNAVFYISFRTMCGVACKGVIRRTRDGRPEHLSLEAKCFV